jgi:predicted RNA-binding Zn-ribbon protein involved in translation (DUF1610 family)
MLEPLRLKRQKLRDELIVDANYEEMHAIAEAELGDVEEFMEQFGDFTCPTCGHESSEACWRTEKHEAFYETCLQIKNLEQTTYHALRKEGMTT